MNYIKILQEIEWETVTKNKHTQDNHDTVQDGHDDC